MRDHYCPTETAKQRSPPPGLPTPDNPNDAAVAVADDSDDSGDDVPFLGTPYASNQRFDYPFPINSLPPDPILGPPKYPSALPIASSIGSAPSLVQPNSDFLASLPSVVSSLVSNPDLSRRSGSTSTDRPLLRHSRSNSSHVSAHSARSLQSLISQGSGSSSPSTHTPPSVTPPKPSSLSSRNSSPNGCHRPMTFAMAPSREARSNGVSPRRPKSLTLSTNQASNLSANPVSSGSSHSSGIGGLSSLSITSIVDFRHIPPTLRSKFQQNGSLIVASYDALPQSTEASARAMPALRTHDSPAQGATLRPAPRPLPKRPLPARAYSHASSFLRASPGLIPIQEPEEIVPATAPLPTEETRINRQSPMKGVIKKTASLVELGLEGLKRAASGRSSASSRRSRTRAGSRAQDTTEASGDGKMAMVGALEAPNVIREEGHSPQTLKVKHET